MTKKETAQKLAVRYIEAQERYHIEKKELDRLKDEGTEEDVLYQRKWTKYYRGQMVTIRTIRTDLGISEKTWCDALFQVQHG